MAYRILFLSFLLCLSANVWSQENNTTDAEVLFWPGVELDYQLNKKWKLGFEQQFRFEYSDEFFDGSISEISLRRKIKKWWNLKLTYRFNADADDRNSSRLAFDSNWSWDLDDNPLDINYRIRFQHQRVFYTGEPRTFLRNKLELDYNLSKRVDPQLAYENFFRFNGRNEIRVHRFHFGLTWKLNKRTDLNTYLRIDNEVNKKEHLLQYILGTSLKHDLN